MNREPKVITKEGALWYVIWGYVVAGLTMVGTIATIIALLRIGSWGRVIVAAYGVMALLVLLLVGLVFRYGIRRQKIVKSCKEKVERAYNMLLMPLFGIIAIFICAMVFMMI